MNMLVGANADADADADADANDWVTTLALLDFVRRAKNINFGNILKKILSWKQTGWNQEPHIQRSSLKAIIGHSFVQKHFRVMPLHGSYRL